MWADGASSPERDVRRRGPPGENRDCTGARNAGRGMRLRESARLPPGPGQSMKWASAASDEARARARRSRARRRIVRAELGGVSAGPGGRLRLAASRGGVRPRAGADRRAACPAALLLGCSARRRDRRRPRDRAAPRRVAHRRLPARGDDHPVASRERRTAEPRRRPGDVARACSALDPAERAALRAPARSVQLRRRER